MSDNLYKYLETRWEYESILKLNIFYIYVNKWIINNYDKISTEHSYKEKNVSVM